MCWSFLHATLAGGALLFLPLPPHPTATLATVTTHPPTQNVVEVDPREAQPQGRLILGAALHDPVHRDTAGGCSDSAGMRVLARRPVQALLGAGPPRALAVHMPNGWHLNPEKGSSVGHSAFRRTRGQRSPAIALSSPTTSATTRRPPRTVCTRTPSSTTSTTSGAGRASPLQRPDARVLYRTSHHVDPW